MGTTQVMTFPGERPQVREARRFVGDVLDGCPVADDAVLLTSEIVTNAVEHTESGGGSFEVTVRRGDGSAVVEVRDEGGAWSRPRVLLKRLDDDESEQGRGWRWWS